MEKKVIQFTTDKQFVRRARELKTLETMIGMYCRHHHRGNALCEDCATVAGYACRRLERCVFGDTKPTCANCLVHCYRADMRERVRVMMRWAGPRMIFRHPIMGIIHKLDGRRPAPQLPMGNRGKRRSTGATTDDT